MIETAERFSAVDAFRAPYRLQALRRAFHRGAARRRLVGAAGTNGLKVKRFRVTIAAM